MITKKIIYGCESRGDGDSPYLTRYTLLQTRWGNLYLHRFHRSDADDLHDHPWAFWSLPLWPGYNEIIPNRHRTEYAGYGSAPVAECIPRKPLRLAFRAATWRHRV